jgi:hypothetical protein
MNVELGQAYILHGLSLQIHQYPEDEVRDGPQNVVFFSPFNRLTQQQNFLLYKVTVKATNHTCQTHLVIRATLRVKNIEGTTLKNFFLAY